MNKNIRALTLLLAVLLFSLSAAAALLELEAEIYPKPTVPDQPFQVLLSVANDAQQIPAPELLELSLKGVSLPHTVKSCTMRDKRYQIVLESVAPVSFDWRRLKIRYDGMDYPAGPDDPYMICDAPFRVRSAQQPIPISATFQDADNDDVQLQYVDVFNDATGALVQSYPVWEWINSPYHYYIFDNLTPVNFNCAAGDTAWIKVVLHCDDDDWPWIPEEYTFTQHLKVRVGRDLPATAGWYYGDIHTHSQYTDNIYEYGGPLEMFSACAEAVGLNFVTITDHSSDFDAAGTLWSNMSSQCAGYSTASVHLIPGEEICLDDNEQNNTIDNRIHYLNYSGQFIRGPEAPISGCRDTSDRFTFLTEAVSTMEISGGFGYAAHPFQDADPFAALFGLAMMPWSASNYDIARASYTFAGLEIWNERNRYKKDVDYWYELNPFPWESNPTWQTEWQWVVNGLSQWDQFLSDGLASSTINPALVPQKLFISAGSDCHGDFNYRTYNTDPIFFDVYATDNAFGNLRTCVMVPGHAPGELPPVEELLIAYRLGKSIITDGPFIDIGIDVNGDDDLEDEEDLRIGDEGIIDIAELNQAQIIIQWESNEDWGTLESLQLLQGTETSGGAPVNVHSFNPGNFSGQQIFPLTELYTGATDDWRYLRLEGVGSPLPDEARRAYTNPIWLRIEENAPVSVDLRPAEDFILIQDGGGEFDYTLEVHNSESTPQQIDFWMDVTLPGGMVYELINTSAALAAGQWVMRERTQSVPAGAPGGAYAFSAHIGDYPDSWSTSRFPFYKTAVSEGGQSDWITALSQDILPAFEGKAHTSISVNLYPQPFNAEVILTLQLEDQQWLSLDIFDVTGRRVEKLFKGRLEAGIRKFSWNADRFPSGIYFYRLTGSDVVLVDKLVYLK